MADFLYKSKITHNETRKFHKLFSLQANLSDSLQIYYNEGTIYTLKNSITILGYAYTIEKNLYTYLSEILLNFSEKDIARIKKTVLGQYIIIVENDGIYYIFSDFIQSRSVYYNIEEQSICSSFSVLHELTENKEIDDYKVFEYFAMRHCLYPVWLGNSTLNNKIKKLRAYEYLSVDTQRESIQVKDLKLNIDNTKTESLKALSKIMLSTFRNVVRHKEIHDKGVYCTITGGFDSRLITGLVNEYYKNINPRIALWKGHDLFDYGIAQKISKKLSLSLTKYETEQRQLDLFYSITDGLSPRENGIMTKLLIETSSNSIGFGGAFGTELFSVLKKNKTELISDYMSQSRSAIQANESYFRLFEKALDNELMEISRHYILKHEEERDHLRIFQVLTTGTFSSPIMSAFNIRGKQFEPFGTYPVIESALKIPYRYLGSKWSFGRFYLIPKILMEKVNLKISKINTTHFCPMRPLSIKTLMSYLAYRIYGKYNKKQKTATETVSITGKEFKYSSSNWFDGLKKTYLSD